MQHTCSVILATDEGEEKKSSQPKVLYEILFKPIIRWVADCCVQTGIDSNCVVLNAGTEKVQNVLPKSFTSVLQSEKETSVQAAQAAQEFIRSGEFQHVLVLRGDTPLVQSQDLQAAYEQHVAEKNQITLLTACVKESSGVYWFDAAFLLDCLANTAAGDSVEYVFSNAVALAEEKKAKIGVYTVQPETIRRAGNQKELAALNRLARETVLNRHMENGVNIPCSDGIIIGPDVKIGSETLVLPGTILRGNTTVGQACEIGPNSYLENAVLGNACRILSSYIDSSTVEDHVKIGPMSNIRPNCHIESDVKIGDFVELKNAKIGSATSVAHLTYVGDSVVGTRCNFGCGVVTVNYDGSVKSQTTIGDDCFIGCNTNLVAPVTLGNRVYSAAGTTVTHDVPDDALVIGRARQTVKENWSKENGRYNRKRKK